MKTHSILRSGAVGTGLAAALAVAVAATPASPVAARGKPAGQPRKGPVAAPVADTAAPRLIMLSSGAGQLLTLPRAISDVFVADDKVADVSPRTPTRLYVFGKAAGETTLSATDKTGTVVYTATVRVGSNIGNLPQMLKLTMPDSQITATPMNGMVVLTGTVAAPDDVAEASRLVSAFVGKDTTIVTRLKTSTPLQVMLKVRFAEVNRDISKAIGFNLLANDTTGGFQFGVAQGNVDVTANKVIKAASGTSFAFAGPLAGLNILSSLDLAETDGYATTLAQPTLTAISGETASFLAGGEIPIPVPQFQGVTTIEYKQYGVSLAFTPTVLGDGRISLRVRPEVSQLTSSTVSINGYSIPGLTTRRAETTVELGSGQSFVIGGLLSANQNNSVTKAPFLGDLPIVGQLFRSNAFKKSESELVIVVTPYLVKPVSDHRIALPTDGYRSPTDLGSILLNKGMAGSNASKRVKPTAEAPVNGTPAGAPVAAAAPVRARGRAPVAAPGFSSN